MPKSVRNGKNLLKMSFEISKSIENGPNYLKKLIKKIDFKYFFEIFDYNSIGFNQFHHNDVDSSHKFG